jgi:hypothetical protein
MWPLGLSLWDFPRRIIQPPDRVPHRNNQGVMVGLARARTDAPTLILASVWCSSYGERASRLTHGTHDDVSTEDPEDHD